MITIGILVFFFFFLIVLIRTFAFTVEQQTTAIIERFRKFYKLASPGLHFKIPIIDRIVHRTDLRVQQQDIEVDTKTKDDVTVSIKVAVHYQVLSEDVYNSYYSLEDEHAQIEAYVFDAIRAQVPSQTLDQVYANRELDKAIEGEVRDQMKAYGYHIIDAPVMEIDPDDAVKVAMNQVNAQQRLLEAARSEGEAVKVKAVKVAEGESESKILQGKGIAGERLAIAQGLKEAEEIFSNLALNDEKCMNILLMTQYFDMLKAIGSNSNTIMLPHTPAGLTDLEAQMRNAVVAASAVEKK